MMKYYLLLTGLTSLVIASSASCAPQEKHAAVPYMLRGPYGKGEPVHEIIAMLALKQAIETRKASLGDILSSVKRSALPDVNSKTAHELTIKRQHDSVQQFLRGVFWPDDPRGWLFQNKKDGKTLSWGLDWYREFRKAKKNPENLKPENLIARSHFGDLQFMHGMSPKPDSKPAEVRTNILTWAGFCADVATGRIEDKSTLESSLPQGKAWFPGKKTVRDLFLAADESTALDIRQRAAGALLHLIQDSYAKCHTERDEKTGMIKRFLCYTADDHDRAEHDDHDRFGPGDTLREKIKNTHGAQSAIESSAKLMVLLDRKAKRVEILALVEQVFSLHKDVTVARPADHELETKTKKRR